MNTKFWKYLAENLTAAQWQVLQDTLGVTTNRFNQLKAGSKDFTFSEVETLASLTGDDPVGLVNRFKLGHRTHTIDDMRTFAGRHGQRVQVQFQAA